MANKKISQLDVRTSPTLADLLAIADPSTGYAYKITGTNLQTVLEIPNKVPYTGATTSVNLGAYGITSDYLQLSTSPTASGAVGRMLWNDQIGSTETTLKGGSVVLKNGVDLVARVVNKVTPAATLTKATYKAVRVSGAQGQRLAIAYAQANTDNNSADTIGLVCETIAANQEGFIITVGQLTGINTTGSLQGETWADGDVLYLSPTTAGNLTNIKPTGATGHIVVIGYVEYAHAINGSIYVKIMNGWELDELHNVYINTVSNNDVLVYESSSTLWKNKSIAMILGYTPQAQLNGTGFVKATGTTISYDNTTYATDSLVVHLAGAENITGVKTFQNALKTTTGNNLLNTGGGNTVIGYTADPASSATYKLDVNGVVKFADYLNVINATPEIRLTGTSTNSGVKGIYFYNNNRTAWVRSTPSGANDTGNLELGGFGANFLTVSGTFAGPTKISVLYSLEGSEFMGNSVNSGSHYYSFNNSEKAVRIVSTRLGSFGRGDFKVLVRTALSSTDAADSDAAIYIPGTNRNVSINNGATDMGYALGVNGTFKATGVLQLSSYTTSSSVPGTVAGLLGFDSSGNVITTSASGGGISGSGTAGQVTYWSGTSAVTGSATLTYTPTTSLLVNNSVTASVGVARGINFTPALTGAANNDVLVCLDVNPTFSSGGFTGIANYGIRSTSADVLIRNFVISSGSINYQSTNTSITGFSNQFFIVNSATNGFVQLQAQGTAGTIRIATGSTTEHSRIFQSGNWGLGTTTDGGQRLQVIGSMRVGTTAASAMYWDDTNNRLGIGTSSPTTSVSIGSVTPTSIYNKGLSLSGSSGDIAVGVYNSSTTGTAGFLLGESNTVYSAFFKWGSTYTGNYPASSIPLANSSQFQSGSTNNLPLIIQGTPIIFNAGNTSTNIAARLSIASLRFTTLANAHTDGTAILDVDGSTTSRASLRIRSGTAPTTPNEGDIWQDGTNIKIYIGGSTKTFTII